MNLDYVCKVTGINQLRLLNFSSIFDLDRPTLRSTNLNRKILPSVLRSSKDIYESLDGR